jgi:hypothetical protein
MARRMLPPGCPQAEKEGRNPTQTGDKVRFRVLDVFLPSPESAFAPPSAEEELEGTVVDFSDSGQKARVFALIDVVRKQTVVVPVEKLYPVPRSEPEAGG